MQTCRKHQIASWIFQVIAAVILGQTLFFKFSGASESKYIFSTLGAEPWGRWATGVAELIIVALLLTPRFAAIGGLGAVGLMTGAIGSHLFKLGIVVQDDGGLLFALAVAAFGSGLIVAWLGRGALPVVGALLNGAGLGHAPNSCKIEKSM
jgi:hypothetical protein